MTPNPPFRPWLQVKLVHGQLLAILEQRRAHCRGVANKRDAVGPRLIDMAPAQNDAAIVIAHEDRIAAQLIQGAIFKRAILGPLKENGPTPVNRPVAAKQRLLGVHEGAATVTKKDPFEMYVRDRFLQFATELNELTLLHDLDL